MTLPYPERDVPLSDPGLTFAWAREFPFRSETMWLGHIDEDGLERIADPLASKFVRKFVKRLHKQRYHFLAFPCSPWSFTLIHASKGLAISRKQWELLYAIAQEEARKVGFKGLGAFDHRRPYRFSY